MKSMKKVTLLLAMVIALGCTNTVMAKTHSNFTLKIVGNILTPAYNNNYYHDISARDHYLREQERLRIERRLFEERMMAERFRHAHHYGHERRIGYRL